MNEIVQVDIETKQAIGDLIDFTLKTKSIKEFANYKKAIIEVQTVMQNWGLIVYLILILMQLIIPLLFKFKLTNDI